MRKNVLTGALAAREYIHFFRDPIGCMCTLHRQRGKLVALGPIAFGEPTKLHVLAIGPEFNRQVLGDPAKFRTTGQFIHGPKDSAQRRILALLQNGRLDSTNRTDVLWLLIQGRDDENRGMTDTELVGQATILFGASFETTASTLTWTTFLLAQHPAIMRELMDELDRVLGGNAPTRDQVPQLSFLDRVIKESMRILPPVPFTIRAAEDDAIPMGSLTLSHGTRVICSHFLTHHLPETYPEPEMFRPARWREIDPTQYEYMPFSAGPRACVGAMFAIQVLKISLATMLQKFRFTVVTGARIDRVVRITMNPRYGMPMLLTKNDRRYESSKVRGQIHEMVKLPLK